MKHRLIWQDKNHRIVELPDDHWTIEDLAGDMFNHEVNPDIPKEQLEKEFTQFKRTIEKEGVWGYVLEKWNPEVDKGWEHVDSCFGFVGQYIEGAEGFDHYIITEMKEKVKQ